MCDHFKYFRPPFAKYFTTLWLVAALLKLIISMSPLIQIKAFCRDYGEDFLPKSSRKYLLQLTGFRWDLTCGRPEGLLVVRHKNGHCSKQIK